jgi:hypothetical protein
MSDIDALLVARIPKAIGTAAGDLIYWTNASTPARLPVGANPNGNVLTLVGGLPAWAVPASGLTPGTELDYAQITTNPAAISAGTEATSVAVVTGNSVTYDGTPSVVEFFMPTWTNTNASTIVTFVLYRDAAVLGQVKVSADTTANNPPVFFKMKDTPSAGAHTYKVAAFVSTASFTPNAGAGGSGNLVPAFLRVTKA